MSAVLIRAATAPVATLTARAHTAAVNEPNTVRVYSTDRCPLCPRWPCVSPSAEGREHGLIQVPAWNGNRLRLRLFREMSPLRTAACPFGRGTQESRVTEDARRPFWMAAVNR